LPPQTPRSAGRSIKACGSWAAAWWCAEAAADVLPAIAVEAAAHAADWNGRYHVREVGRDLSTADHWAFGCPAARSRALRKTEETL